MGNLIVPNVVSQGTIVLFLFPLFPSFAVPFTFSHASYRSYQMYGFPPFCITVKGYNEAVAFSACCISCVSHLLASFRDFLNSHTTPSPILISLLLWFYFFLFLFQWDIPGNWRGILISPPPFVYWSPFLAS